jgi:hypothetical protein
VRVRPQIAIPNPQSAIYKRPTAFDLTPAVSYDPRLMSNSTAIIAFSIITAIIGG